MVLLRNSCMHVYHCKYAAQMPNYCWHEDFDGPKCQETIRDRLMQDGDEAKSVTKINQHRTGYQLELRVRQGRVGGRIKANEDQTCSRPR